MYSVHVHVCEYQLHINNLKASDVLPTIVLVAVIPGIPITQLGVYVQLPIVGSLLSQSAAVRLSEMSGLSVKKEPLKASLRLGLNSEQI